MKLADIVYCEWIKLKRSKIILIGVLGSLIVPFLVIINNIRISLSNSAASLSLSWIYEDTIMFLMLLFGPLILTVTASYLISREYTEKTLKTIFVVPIKRSQFLIGKFMILFILVLLFMILSWLDIMIISIICSLFLNISQITLLSAISILIQMLKGGILLFTTLTPFVYLTLCTKGTVVPFIAIAVISLLNVVLSGSPIAGFYPWTATYLLLTGRLEQSGCPIWFQILLILFLCTFSIGASILKFQKRDII